MGLTTKSIRNLVHDQLDNSGTSMKTKDFCLMMNKLDIENTDDFFLPTPVHEKNRWSINVDLRHVT
jgi:hypothetical protein